MESALNKGPVNASVANAVINGHSSNARPQTLTALKALKSYNNNHNHMNKHNINSLPQNTNKKVSLRQRKRQTLRKNRKQRIQRKNRKTERKSR